MPAPAAALVSPGESLLVPERVSATASTAFAVGQGRIWSWRPGERPPLDTSTPADHWLGLVYLRAGRVAIGTGAEGTTLEAGDLALIDRRRCTRLTTDTDTRKLVLELPRHGVVARHAQAATLPCLKLPRGGGPAVLRDFMLSVQAEAPRLTDPAGGDALLRAAIELLAAVPWNSAVHRRPGEAVLARALALIRAGALDPATTAASLAEQLGLSRRRLDEILAAHGCSAHQEIWAQRLNWAAEALRTASPQRKVIDIALSAGFKDAAHFSRAFRRRFGCSPVQWRMGPAGRAAPREVHSSSR